MRRSILVAGAAAAFALVPAGAAQATAFSGQCSISGTATFSPALTAPIAETDFSFSGGGSCTGRVDNVNVSGEPVTAAVSGNGPLSCLGGFSTGAVGTLSFPQQGGKSLRFTLDLAAAGSQVALHVAGTTAGTAGGRASFLEHAGPDTAAACAGAGAQSLDFDALVQTVTVLKG